MHLLEMPRARRNRGRLRTLTRPGSAADDRGDPGGGCLVQLRWREQVHMRVDRAGREDPTLARDDVRRRSDPELWVDAVCYVRVSRSTERDDVPVADAHVGPDDAPPIDHQHVGDDGIRRAFRTSRRTLPHRLPDRLPPAEHNLLTADCEVLL